MNELTRVKRFIAYEDLKDLPSVPEWLPKKAPAPPAPRHRRRKRRRRQKPTEASILAESLGFTSYQKYLKSEQWKAIRERVFSKCGRNCCKCGQDANQIHHLRYTLEAFRGQDLTDLVPVCWSCHKAFHRSK